MAAFYSQINLEPISRKLYYNMKWIFGFIILGKSIFVIFIMMKSSISILGRNVRSSSMKKIIFPLLFLTIAAAAYAGDDKVASTNNDISHGTKNIVFPPVVTEQYEYYEIKGNNERELRNQMCRNGCTFNDGKIYDSLTTWRVKLDYGYDRATNACAADSVKANVVINFRFPKWMRTEDAPPELVAKWDNYMKNLVIHENEHRDMAVEAATELSKAVSALPPASSCAELDREVRALSLERMEKLNDDEKRLDETTSHGKTEGAIFP